MSDEFSFSCIGLLVHYCLLIQIIIKISSAHLTAFIGGSHQLTCLTV